VIPEFGNFGIHRIEGHDVKAEIKWKGEKWWPKPKKVNDVVGISQPYMK